MAAISNTYSAEERLQLLAIATQTINHGVRHGIPGQLNASALPPTLLAARASFVTLELDHHLRGCIGSLEPIRPLAMDVNENAFAAAFHDPRFPPLTENELPVLNITISVLSIPEVMTFHSEQDLIAQLRPGVDGLILEEGRHRSTFLPAVWESLPESPEFLRQLKRKAGLHPDHWSRTMRIHRYQAEKISKN